MRRLVAIFSYLEIDANEARQLVQWAALAIMLIAALIIGAVMTGLAWRAFTCAGGISC